MYFISQVSQHDCGFACLKMLLANYHHDKNYLFLPTRDGPYSFKDLTEIAKEHHMEAIGIKISDVKELKEGREFPFIVNLEKKKGFKHSVLLLAVRRKHVKIFDPESGKRTIPLELFYDQWDQKALIVNRPKNYEKVKCTRS